MTDYKKIKGYYDEYGKTYHKERDDTYYYSFINEIETSVISKYGQGKKTLEIGCGTGIILKEVSSFANEAWGLDLSTGMLENARSQGLNVVEGNAAKIPFPDENFDVVYSFKVLPHVPELEQAILEINRVLKPGGKAILEFYNSKSIKAITNKLSGAPSKVYIQYHSPEEIAKLVDSKFKITEVVGARIVTPAALFHKIPLISSGLKKLEKKLSNTAMSRFAGYYIVVLEKSKT